jgi:hypothetical protein
MREEMDTTKDIRSGRGISRRTKRSWIVHLKVEGGRRILALYRCEEPKMDYLLSRLFGDASEGRFERIVVEDLNVSGMSKNHDYRSCNVLKFEFTPVAALPKRRATC